MDKFIPDDLAEFIVNEIDSVGHLEALLLLRRDPGTKWSIDALAKRLYADANQLSEIVARLCSGGLAAEDQGDPSLYFYRPRSDALRELVDRLAEAYAKHLVPVTNLIHAQPKSRVQEFAEAFKVRKDK